MTDEDRALIKNLTAAVEGLTNQIAQPQGIYHYTVMPQQLGNYQFNNPFAGPNYPLAHTTGYLQSGAAS